LRGGPYVFGTMTSLLVRCDLIRTRRPFFNEQNLHADQEACFDVLQESDFGFVHQVLTFTRPPDESMGSRAKEFDSIILGDFVILLKYGPVYLDTAEYEERLRELRADYYRVLARNVLRLRGKPFWKYHVDTLAAFGATIDRVVLTKAVAIEMLRRVTRPVRTV